MPRQVIINESAEPAYAIAYSDTDKAFRQYKKLLLAAPDVKATYGTDSAEYAEIKNAKTIEDLGDWPDCSSVMLQDEGDLGVWTGFSSADRCAMCGPLPLVPGEFIGNGDPNFYLTKGVRDGTKAQATPSVKDGVIHELYQAAVDADDDDKNVYIELRDRAGRPFVLYGHDDSWCAVYTDKEETAKRLQHPAEIDEYETAELALQNIQEASGH
jgi:hypothetical protein